MVRTHGDTTKVRSAISMFGLTKGIGEKLCLTISAISLGGLGELLFNKGSKTIWHYRPLQTGHYPPSAS
jgi:hypothetical protein